MTKGFLINYQVHPVILSKNSCFSPFLKIFILCALLRLRSGRRLCPLWQILRTVSHGDLAIDYLRFTIDYLISSLHPLCPLWLNNEYRVMEIFLNMPAFLFDGSYNN